MVEEFTGMGAVVVLDLHWNTDDLENEPMARKSGAANALDFWDSVSSTFAGNELVFYELYNEPHKIDQDIYLNGNDEYAGVLEMISTIRKNDADQMLVIAGGGGWAYDSDSLIALEALTDDNLLMFNFHTYMGPK
jgi:hypothetical protein